MRDKLIHQYFGVDLEAVWKVTKMDCPNRFERLERF